MTDADEKASEGGERRAWPPRATHFGEATVTVDVDEATYERLHEAYLVACEGDYPGTFDTFVYNYTSTTTVVTVDGEPVDPRDEEAEP